MHKSEFEINISSNFLLLLLTFRSDHISYLYSVLFPLFGIRDSGFAGTGGRLTSTTRRGVGAVGSSLSVWELGVVGCLSHGISFALNASIMPVELRGKGGASCVVLPSACPSR